MRNKQYAALIAKQREIAKRHRERAEAADARADELIAEAKAAADALLKQAGE